MKKNLFFASIILCFFCQSLSAQFTLRVAGGYAWPGLQNSENIMAPLIDPFNPGIDALAPMANIQDTMNGKPASYKSVHGSYGQGMNFTLGLGYAVNKYFGVELGISYLQSAGITSTETRQLTLFNGIGYSVIPYYLTATTTSKAIGVSVSPAVIIKAPFKKSKFMPYARAGISLPVYGGLTDHIIIDQNASATAAYVAKELLSAPYFLGSHTDVIVKTQGTVSLGVNAAIGVTYRLLPFLSISLEVNGQHLITRAKSAQITRWNTTVDSGGQAITTSQIQARGVYRTQFNFVDQLNGSSNNSAYNTNTDLNKPKDDIRPTGPFSNLGLNIALTFTLGKKTLHKKKDEVKTSN